MKDKSKAFNIEEAKKDPDVLLFFDVVFLTAF